MYPVSERYLSLMLAEGARWRLVTKTGKSGSDGSARRGSVLLATRLGSPPTYQWALAYEDER